MAAQIQAEARMLATLIADVQAAATVERDDFAISVQPVPLATLLAQATTVASLFPGAHTLSSSGATDALVYADAARIGQVLRNLIGNAAKYSPCDTPIAIDVRVSGSRVTLSVIDRGPGIHHDDLQRIFEKFGRGRDLRGHKVPGIGLGLYLSRRIIQAHDSDLSVRSTLGEGSMFSFDLEVAS